MAADRLIQDRLGPPGNSSQQSQGETPRIFPPFGVWGIALFAIITIFIFRSTNLTADHAIDNILTLALGFFALMTVILWFTLYSGHSLFVRLIPLSVLFVSISVFVIFYRIDHVSGELVPVFARRFSANPDQLLPQLQRQLKKDETRRIDLATSSDHDFPQFLGPERQAVVPGPRLSPAWATTAPRQLWKKPIGAGWSAFSAVNGYAVTMEQRGPLELVVCYDLKTGVVQWSHATTARYQNKLGGIGPRSTPTIHQGKVYSLGVTGQLLCLDGADGKLLWKRDLRKEFGISPEEDEQAIYYGRSNSPLIVDNTVIIPAGGPPAGNQSSLVAYDKDTGEEIWRGGSSQISYSSPSLVTLCGVRQILIVNLDNIAGHDPTTGKELWQHEWVGDNFANASASQALAVDGDRVFVSKGYGVGAMLLQISNSPDSEWSAEKIWSKHNALRTKFTNIVIKDDCAYGLSDGILQCVDIDTGKIYWKRGRYGHGQILLVGDLILVLSEKGNLHLVEAVSEKHHELAKFPAIEGKTWNNICLYGPYLLVRNSEQAACYELPTE